MANQTGLERDAKYFMKDREKKSNSITKEDIEKLKKENEQLIEKKKMETEYAELQKQNIALKHPKRTAFFKGVSRAGLVAGTEISKVGKGLLASAERIARKELKRK